MAAYVLGKRSGETDASPDFFQMTVDLGQGVVALLADVSLGVLYNGQEVGRGGR